MVDLLALAHDRGCEAELAAILAEDLAALPEGVVRLIRLDAYEELLGGDTGEAS